MEPEPPNDEPAKAFLIVITTLAVLLTLLYFLYGKSSSAHVTSIRVRNHTGTPLQEVNINGVVYGDIGVGGVTRYKNMAVAYRYADLQVVMAGKKIHLQPEDYVGEQPLGQGRFTLISSLEVEESRLSSISKPLRTLISFRRSA